MAGRVIQILLLLLIKYNYHIMVAGKEIQLTGNEPGYLCVQTIRHGIPMCKIVSIPFYAQQKAKGSEIQVMQPISCFDVSAREEWQFCYQKVSCDPEEECKRKCEKSECMRITFDNCPGVFIYKGAWCTARRAAAHIGKFYRLGLNQTVQHSSHARIHQSYCKDYDDFDIYFADCQLCRYPFCPSK